MKILVVCTGNRCRSQMAHGILKSIDPTLTVCPAGTRPASEYELSTSSIYSRLTDAKPTAIKLA